MIDTQSFWDKSDYNSEHNPPAGDKEIIEAESRLGVTLPALLKNLYKTHNGGYVAHTQYKMPDGEYEEIILDGCLEELDFLDSLETWLEGNWDHDAWDGLIAEPGKLVVIAKHGFSAFLCLDYSACTADSEPGVMFIDCLDLRYEPEIPIRFSDIGSCFSSLVTPQEEEDFAPDFTINDLVNEINSLWDTEELFPPTIQGINDAIDAAGSAINYYRLFYVLLTQIAMCDALKKEKETQALIGFCRRFNPSKDIIESTGKLGELAFSKNK